MKTLVGITTFGNLGFTQLAVNSIRETSKEPLDFYLIVGKPGDWATMEWLEKENIPHVMHTENLGFPVSINDIYDYGWKANNYDNIIIAGNDIVAYPYAIDSMIKVARETDYECISATEVDVRTLVKNYPETATAFRGGNFIFDDFSRKPWETFKGYSEEISLMPMQLLDIQNLCLYKKSVFEKVGYTDANFFPAYFIDNDYVRRLGKAGVMGCSLANAKFFHFWSRTIHQESGGTTHKQFKNNENYYKQKWGGPVGGETKDAPIAIFDRSKEIDIARYWRNKK